MQAPPTPQNPSASAIHLSLEFFPLAFLLFLCTPVVVINGVPNKLSWGKHQFEFPPGDYHVTVYFAYLFLPECGKNSVSLRLDPGATRLVRFYMWGLVFLPGQMSVH